MEALFCCRPYVQSSSEFHAINVLQRLHEPTNFRYLRVKRITMCHGATHSPDLKRENCSVLHSTLESCGIDATHARAAREKFIKEVNGMCNSEREVSISKCIKIDLGRAALEIAAEDDALISHSSVSLPVDAYISRLDVLSMEFCRHFLPPRGAPPHIFPMNLERFMYIHKEFKRTPVSIAGDIRGLYLNTVLTRRTGSVIMLALIYAEIVKTVKILGFLDVDIEIDVPHHPTFLPRGYILSDLQGDQGYHKVKGRSHDPPHVLTTQMFLTEILGNLKEIFWPFQYDPNVSGSLFLRAAYAANCGVGPSIVNSESAFEPNSRGVELANAKAAEHRLRRGVWTSTRYGDLRRAVAACERLVLLGVDARELRDYSILLYHCGLYEKSFEYLQLYCSSK
ncbi:hypothetical protein KI387_038978, partial [Taxus chinensis]